MQKKSTWGKTILFSICSFVLSSQMSAQSCNCAVTIALNTPSYDASLILPGQTICLAAGTRTQNLRISNINGSNTNRVIIKNCSGKVTFNTPLSTSYNLWIQNSVNFRLTGTGSSDSYGIELVGSVNALQVGVNSTDFEIDHIESRNCGFAGIMAKTDNSGPRSGFKMKNVSIHDNYTHDLNGEGLYIGNTSWTVNGQQHDIDSLYVYNNITNNTGREGVQVGCTYSGNAWVHHNKVTNSGLDTSESFQTNGIQLGGGFSGYCYDNYTAVCNGNGIIVTGPGNVYVFNNIIVQPGGFGIYSGNATAEAGKTFHYLHNTIIMGSSTLAAVKFDPSTSSIAKVYNNAIQRTDTTLNNSIIAGSGTLYKAGNVIRATNGSFKFENPATANYDLLAGSDAINTGSNIIDTFHVQKLLIDYEDRPRPIGSGYDAGAYEYQVANQGGGNEEGTILYRVNAGGLEVADSAVNWITDKQPAPCIYFENVGSNQTTGSDNPWGGTNNTDAPSQIFSTNRFAGNNYVQVHYNFPVTNGSYIVNLYFADNASTAAGQRIEDVSIEGVLKMDNLDIYAASGGTSKALKASFTVTVSDGVLDINFIRVTGNPQINGIEIRSDDAGSRLINPPVTQSSFNLQNSFTQNIKAYPVPLEGKVYIEKIATGSTGSEEVEITLFNDMGTVLYRGKHAFSGNKTDPIDLSRIYMRQGTYFIRLSGPVTNGTIRLLKQ